MSNGKAGSEHRHPVALGVKAREGRRTPMGGSIEVGKIPRMVGADTGVHLISPGGKLTNLRGHPARAG
jgi:hypothetical protein